MIPEKNIKRYEKFFNISNNPHDNLLTGILEFDIEEMYKEPDFNFDDFNEFLYYENDYKQKMKEKVLDNIVNSKRFQILYGYAKNGKSTLLKKVIYDNNSNAKTKRRYKSIFFDFAKIFVQQRKGDISTNYPLFESCINFFKDKFCQFKNINDEKDKNVFPLENFLEYVNFISSLQNNLINNKDQDSLIFRQYFTSYMYDLASETKDFLSKYRDENQNIFKIQTEYIQAIEEKLKNTIRNSNHDLFCFLVLYEIFNNKNIFTENGQKDVKKRNKLIFILDNIDDIKTDTALDILENYTRYICVFLKVLSKVVSKTQSLENSLKGLNVETDILVIFAFRTANYLNARAHIHSFPPSNNERTAYQGFTDAEKINIKTIRTSHQIIDKRIDFFKNFKKAIDKNQISVKNDNQSLNNKLKFYDILIKHTERYCNNRDINTPDPKKHFRKNLFRFWNGDKLRFMRYINNSFQIIEEKYFNEKNNFGYFFEKIQKDYLISGFFIFLSLELMKNANVGSIGEILHNLVEFEGNIAKNKISLKRLLLTYVVNESEKNKLKKSIMNRGVGLFDLLENFTKIKNNKNQLLYKEEEIEKMLNFFFFHEIDHWGHLLSVIKLTKRKDEVGNTIQGKIINFSQEIKCFFNNINKRDKSRIKSILNQVRLFNNDNAAFFVNRIQPHFEFFSFGVQNDKPLIFAINKLNKDSLKYKKEIKDYLKLYNSIAEEDQREKFEEQNKKFEFEFELYIEKVFFRAEYCIKVIMDCYIEYFSDELPPKDFCNSTFALNGSFYCVQLIARHITYIDQFRIALLNDHLLNSNDTLSDEQKIQYNELLLNKLDRYIDLGLKGVFGKIQEHGIIMRDATSLNKSRTTFLVLKKLIKDFKKDGSKNFTQYLQTDSEQSSGIYQN